MSGQIARYWTIWQARVASIYIAYYPYSTGVGANFYHELMRGQPQSTAAANAMMAAALLGHGAQLSVTLEREQIQIANRPALRRLAATLGPERLARHLEIYANFARSHRCTSVNSY